ncbi:MAG: PxxKW family cysteine-rich protein [Desulfamplus sp.]|nr:PxxKW family cysteine-rich protein [Desulfamplus sp.]MBF0388829.1 PxxKW family cysteine-rich protein [Desulfamplus sp.]
MICTTVRNGDECVFMSNRGCKYNGGECKPIVEKCEGCQRVVENDNGKFCTAAPDPAMKWKNGICNLATHVKVVVEVKKQKLNPIKASKRK